MKGAKNMINTHFTIFGQDIKLSRNIVKDYEIETKTPLTNELIEQEIKETLYGEFISLLNAEQLNKVAERVLRDEIYEPYVSLPLYDGTKIITLPKRTVHHITNAIPFTTRHVEALLDMSRFNDIAKTMSNEELSKAAEEELIEDAHMMVHLPELQKRVEEQWIQKK